MPSFRATPQEFQAAQLNFDWLLPWGPSKQTLTTEEASRCMGISQESVRALVDMGELEAHQFNIQGQTSRLTSRVTRRSVTVWLMKTAKYGPEEIVGGVLEIWKTLTAEQRKAFLAKTETLLGR